MAQTKTLGGDRLGSGKKMKVHLHGYERSTHDLSYLWRSTMSAGTLVPFMSEVALPGDTFDINLQCEINTHPTIGPLFGSEKVQLDIFLAPIRLYNSLLHNNMLGIGMNMAQVKLPQLRLVANENKPNFAGLEDKDNSMINPSCLLAYLGIRGVGLTDTPNQERLFNAIPLLAYWEIYKNYYANKMEEIGAVIHTPTIPVVMTVDDIQITNRSVSPATDTEIPHPPAVPSAPIPVQLLHTIDINYTGAAPDPRTIMINTIEHGVQTAADLYENWIDDTTNTVITGYFDVARWGNITVDFWNYRGPYDVNQQKPEVATFPLENIDNARREILKFDSTTAPFIISNTAGFSEEPYGWVVDDINEFPNMLSSQEGLALKTYQSDLFNNWLQTEWIDGTNGISEITAIDTSAGFFTLDTLNLSKKVYEMLNRIAVSGGSYNDWLDAVYDHPRQFGAESPMYMGGLIKELVFQEVVSNAVSGDQPLGTLAGKGVMSKKHKGGHVVVKVDEPSYIIGIVSITPRIDYSQGNKWDTHLKTIDDLHKPQLDEIGFQELITEQQAWWSTEYDAGNSEWVQRSAGKQPAWLNYMTNTNRIHGNFAIPNNEMFMVFNRRYEWDEVGGGIKDLTTYIDPSKFNFIFAQTALDAQNYWTQIAVDITARRKMSAKLMPNV